jgi:3-oxoacyl-[acyl-carrier protein] reductase
MLLKGKNAIVTGSNRGIGRAIVEAFAKNGACIWAHARKETPEFHADMDAVGIRYGLEIRRVFFDATDENAMKTAVKEIASSKQPVDVLVNNAGVAHGGLFQMTSLHKIREVFDINFFSALQLSQLIVRLMQQNRKGSIINISSTSGFDLKAGNIAYGVSKAALMAATKTLASELGSSGIRVNAIAPGLTDTDMAKLIDKKVSNDSLSHMALNRYAEPAEIAEVAVFLAADMSSFITGQILRVDGGSI